ncbi:uncharacterized protein LOC135388500 [Ornithodoros turicata]|uniref:uncharacterized protein LOC135388500 n=1 Tax=Ornithodoros turicata TaxID=34597 RepID=UPI00313894BC
MRFALIIATFVAGALAGPFEALDHDSVSLPDVRFDVPGHPASQVELTHGKVEGLSKVLRPGRDCYGRYTCDVLVSGLHVTYKAVANAPEREFDVVVDVLHGLLHLDSRKTAGGKYDAKNVRVRALHQYVRKPVKFGTDRKQNALFDEELKKKLLELLKEVARTELFSGVLNEVLDGDTSKRVAAGPSEVTGVPFKAVFEDHVAFPDFEISVSGAPRRNVTFTKGRAGPLSVVLKPTRGSHGAYNSVLSLKDMRVIYEAVAIEPKEEFQLVVDVMQGLVKVERRKTAGGKFELKDVTFEDLKVSVEKPAEFSSDGEQNTLFQEEVKKTILEFVELFLQGEVVNDALTDFGGDTPQLTSITLGALAGPFDALDHDSVSLPDVRFDVPGHPASQVELTHGKVEGLSKVLRPGRDCYGRYTCDVLVSGLHVTYKAVATAPEREFDVVVDVLHGLLHLDSRKTTGGKYEAKNVRVRALHQYVRKPVKFGTDRKQNALFDEELKKKLLELLKEVARTELFSGVLNEVLDGDTSKRVVTGPSEVTGVPFKAVFEDHVAFPDFEISVSGAPTRNVTFTKGRAGPLSVVLKPTRGSHGAYNSILSLKDMRVIYEAVATEPKEEFQLVVDVMQGLVKVERRKTVGGKFELKDVTFEDLKVSVEKPAEFSSDGEQNTLFEEEVKKTILEFVELFVQGEVVNDALTDFGADIP